MQDGEVGTEAIVREVLRNGEWIFLDQVICVVSCVKACDGRDGAGLEL
jgi:hypothetical protein